MKYRFGSSFFKSAFDSLRDQIAVIDASGDIVYVNKAWNRFSDDNGGANHFEWIGFNYLSVFSHDVESQSTQAIRKGIFDVLNDVQNSFVAEYPCHSAESSRWFSMQISKLAEVSPPLFIISHSDITEHKNLQDALLKQSMTDALTGLPNKRHLTYFLEKEWNRAKRANTPISCIILDIDYFKKLNDHYGHLIGDKCLEAVAGILTKFSRREGEIVARWGGEEFILVLANVTQAQAFEIAELIRVQLMHLKLSFIQNMMTISCGVATTFPKQQMEYSTLLSKADAALYMAKKNGRNQTRIYVEAEKNPVLAPG